MIRPLHNYVVVQKSTMTESGILLTQKDTSPVAIVRAISDEIMEPAYSVGDKVVFDEARAVFVPYMGEEYILLQNMDIVGVLE